MKRLRRKPPAKKRKAPPPEETFAALQVLFRRIIAVKHDADELERRAGRKWSGWHRVRDSLLEASCEVTSELANHLEQMEMAHLRAEGK